MRSFQITVMFRCPKTAQLIAKTTHFPVPTTHFPVPTTHFPVPTTHFSVPTTHFPVPTTILSQSVNLLTLRQSCNRTQTEIAIIVDNYLLKHNVILLLETDFFYKHVHMFVPKSRAVFEIRREQSSPLPPSSPHVVECT